MRTPKTKVFVISDCAARRKELTDSLWGASELELVGVRKEPLSVLDPHAGVEADVVLLDAGPSRMDAHLLLRRIQKTIKTPVVVLAPGSGLGTTSAIELLEAGAIDVFNRSSAPPLLPPEDYAKLVRSLDLCRKLRRKTTDASPTLPAPGRGAAPLLRANRSAPGAQVRHPSPKPVSPSARFHPRQLIVVGASTGGTEAIRDVLMQLPANLPGICIVQHIPAAFSKAFAARLNTQCPMEVREAVEGDQVRPGLALIAPGGFHMQVAWHSALQVYVVRLNRGPEEHHQRPAVDVLFRSAAIAGGSNITAVLLTGMGKDGALGMKAVREAGGFNIAQDRRSSVVFGMPAAAQELGVVDQVASLVDVPQAIMRRVMVSRSNVEMA